VQTCALPISSTHPIYSDAGNTPSRVLGSPIRTPSDHSSVGSSPRLIAASYVLHRLLVPRHPPCALTHLHSTQQLKMLASTVQFSNNTHRPHPHPPHGEHIGNQCHQKQPRTPQGPDGAVSDTQQCASSGPHSPRAPALSRHPEITAGPTR